MSQQLEQPRLTVDVGPDDHIRGPAAAPLTLVEYGDYECPYCGAAYPIVKEIERILGAELRSVFRNFPLSEVHPHAFQAAEAAEAALLSRCSRTAGLSGRASRQASTLGGPRARPQAPPWHVRCRDLLQHRQ